jgi:cathepsin L
VLEFWSKKDGFPKSLSAQSLMDCTSGTKRPDDACQGGLMEYVFEYARRHPVPLAVDAPFLERSGKCPSHQWSHVKVNNYKVLMISDSPKAESEIEWLLHAYGPVAVGIDSTNMEHYKDGIFKASMCSNDIDHAVTIVGYTKDAWIIKNSWSNKWGRDGYLYLERGKNACGVAEYIVYITDATPIHKKLSTYWWYM